MSAQILDGWVLFTIGIFVGGGLVVFLFKTAIPTLRLLGSALIATAESMEHFQVRTRHWDTLARGVVRVDQAPLPAVPPPSRHGDAQGYSNGKA